MNSINMEKVVITESCFGRYIDIDGIDFNEFPPNKIKSYIIDKVNQMDQYELRQLFEDMVYSNASDIQHIYKDSCEQCAGWNTKTELTL